MPWHLLLLALVSLLNRFDFLQYQRRVFVCLLYDRIADRVNLKGELIVMSTFTLVDFQASDLLHDIR